MISQHIRLVIHTGISMKLVFNERYVKNGRGIPFDEIHRLKLISTMDRLETAMFTAPDDVIPGISEFSTGSGHWDKLVAYLMSTTEHYIDIDYGGIHWTARSLTAKLEGVSSIPVSRIARWVRISRNDSVMIGVVTPHFYEGHGVDHQFTLYSNDDSFHPMVALMLDHFIKHSPPKEPLFTVG